MGSALIAELATRGVDAQALGSRGFDLADPINVSAIADRLSDDSTLYVACRASPALGREAAFSKDMAILANVARCLQGRALRGCVYVSSFSVYGNAKSDLAITEETPTAPDTPYAVSKYAGELMLAAATTNGTPLLIVRPPMVYGPGDTSRAYGPARFIRSLLETGEIRLFGDGRELRSYVHVRDLARATVELSLRGQSGIFCVDPGTSCSFVDLIDILARVSRRVVRIVEQTRDRACTDQRASPAKLLRVLPDFRFTELETGLAEAYRHFSDARTLVPR